MKYRRTISFSARAYVRLRRWATAERTPLAAIVERVMMDHLDALGCPRVTQHDAIADLDAGRPGPGGDASCEAQP